jgi:KipI family sensor histidine kinase inhibitor
MQGPGPKFSAAGDCALVAEFGNEIREDINARVIDLARSLAADPVEGIIETVPTYRSLLVHFDPLVISHGNLAAILAERTSRGDASKGTARKRRLVEIPVRYGDSFGEDLSSVAAHASVSEDDAVRMHSGRDYLVYMLGFLPGFAYLGGMDPRLATPRLASPRRAIPAGSVAIGGEQTGVYPIASPGGWRLIGKTPITLYDPKIDSANADPVLLRAGDLVRFRSVDDAEFADISDRVIRDAYKPVITERGSWE